MGTPVHKVIEAEKKKVLYKKKPIAIRVATMNINGLDYELYRAMDGKDKFYFEVPHDEMTDAFGLQVSAQLLIRWMV